MAPACASYATAVLIGRAKEVIYARRIAALQPSIAERLVQLDIVPLDVQNILAAVVRIVVYALDVRLDVHNCGRLVDADPIKGFAPVPYRNFQMERIVAGIVN